MQMRDEAGSVLDRFRQGDVDAFEMLFRTHQRAVFGWVLRIVREPGAAEDVTIEAFWRMHRAHARFDPERGFEPWARRIATHAALDWLRRKKPENSLPPEMWQSMPAPRASDAAVAAEIRQKTVEAFGRLPAKLRVAAVLAVVEERPHKEVAKRAGNYSFRREIARVSRAEAAAKGFEKNGDYTMTKSRDQETEIRNQEGDRMTALLQSAMPRVGDDADLPRDLWPAMLRRMDEQSPQGAASVPWFDWALAGGLVAFAAIAPRTIPVILYYL